MHLVDHRQVEVNILLKGEDILSWISFELDLVYATFIG